MKFASFITFVSSLAVTAGGGYYAYTYVRHHYFAGPAEAIQPALGLLYIALMLAAYLIPTFIAEHRKHHQAGAIAVMNLLLGWSGLGWIGALIWAMTAVRPQAQTAA